MKVEAPEEDILRFLERKVITRDNPNTTPVLKEVVADAYDRLIAPAIEREIRSSLTEMAEDGAIRVFGKNLEQLLMQPPIALFWIIKKSKRNHYLCVIWQSSQNVKILSFLWKNTKHWTSKNCAKNLIVFLVFPY